MARLKELWASGNLCAWRYCTLYMVLPAASPTTMTLDFGITLESWGLKAGFCLFPKFSTWDITNMTPDSGVVSPHWDIYTPHRLSPHWDIYTLYTLSPHWDIYNLYILSPHWDIYTLSTKAQGVSWKGRLGPGWPWLTATLLSLHLTWDNWSKATN